ncbi:hypothetical protein V9L05_18675 [Bernardetia sp. Wsw4-3y2]|uniref:hypothetical protein n=1 Tax=Bernardetia sp. Wsw4-3y2 TaxID=3127471 RepID=UPI0030D49872
MKTYSISFILSIFLIAFSVLSVFGQINNNAYASVQMGKEYSISRRGEIGSIIGYDKTGFYLLKFETKSLFRTDNYLEHYDINLNQIKSEKLELEDDYTLVRISQLNGNLYLFSQLLDKKTKEKTLFVQQIDSKSLKFKGQKKQIAQISFEGNRSRNSGSFSFSVARDTSKILVYYQLPYEKKENEKFGFHVFDNDMNLLWSKNVILPYEDKLLGVTDYKIDKKGNVHLLSILYKEKARTKRAGKPNYSYKILSYTDEGKTLKEYDVVVKDKFLTDMQLAIADNSNLICAGFYSNVGTFSIEGSYFLTIDSESKQIKTKSFKEFGLDFITQDMSEKQKKKTKKKADKGKDVELYEYDLNNIILKEDGGAVLVGEQFYIRESTIRTTGANGQVSSRTNYYYNYHDIIVISISPAGEIDWAHKVPKRQTTVNDGGYYSSYTLAIVGDKLHFVFNDNARNIYDKSLKEGKVYSFSYKNLAVALNTVDSNGKQNRISLLNTPKKEEIVRPKVSVQVSKNEMILFAKRKKKYQFIRITFKD